MKLHIMSDLHFEFRDPFQMTRMFLSIEAAAESFKPDALVLAGDICQHSVVPDFKEWMQRLANLYPRVFYVPGNHEYYGSSFEATDAFLKGNLPVGIENLNDGPIDFHGKRFVGGTMWYPYYADAEDDKRLMADFHYIQGFEPEVYVRHGRFVKLAQTFKEGDIVVSHHAPHPNSIHSRYMGSRINRFFNVDMSAYMNGPALWVHGHTHHAFDYHVGTTRVYANPMGYPGEGANPGFWTRIQVEI